MIDFPQVVQPNGNPAAWNIFQRDVLRICEYFSTQGIKTDARMLATDHWTAHGHSIFKPVDPRHLDAENPADAQFLLLKFPNQIGEPSCTYRVILSIPMI